MFAAPVVERMDDRVDYGEDQVVTVGLLTGRVVVIVWTEREDTVRIISMRHATKGEADDYFRRVG